MSEDLIGLLVIASVVAFMGFLCVVRVRRYDPDGDKCPHGVRGGEGFKCVPCDGREYVVQVHTADGLVDEYLMREGEGETVSLRRDC